MSNEDAASITQIAANAADALTKVAAAEAAAVVEVAAAAHANLAPSVIVASMFETLQRQIEKVGERLDEGNVWMAQAERRADARHTKLGADVKSLDEKVGVQNGGVTRALDWMRAHDARVQHEADIAFGAQMVKDKARGRVEALWGKIEKPVVYGVALMLFGFGVRIGAMFIGGPW